MAKRSEDGIEYFPVNTDIVHNPKIRLVVAEFGPKAWTVLLPLYCKIYREKGYWIDWIDEDSKLLFAQDECKIELSVVNEFVEGCLRRSLFNKRVFEMFGILTSDRIQENYLEAKKRNKFVDFILEFSCISDNVYNRFKNVNIIDLNVNIIKKKVDISPQKKKEKKIIEGEGDKPDVHTENEKTFFNNFQKFIIKEAPNVGRMKNPFTITEYLSLKNDYTSDQIMKGVKKMHNYKPLLQKNISAYLTFLNWFSDEKGKLSISTEPDKNNVNERLKAAWKK